MATAVKQKIGHLEAREQMEQDAELFAASAKVWALSCSRDGVNYSPQRVGNLIRDELWKVNIRVVLR